MDKALEMLQTALAWRASREPHTLRASMQEMQFQVGETGGGTREQMDNPDGRYFTKQGQTGKIYLAGTDRWGRPVVIFNNSVNNSNDPRAQMRYLAFNLETALRQARVRVERKLGIGGACMTGQGGGCLRGCWKVG